jgi:hypothetical protein
METWLFNAATVGLTTVAIPLLVCARGKLSAPRSAAWIALLIGNAFANAMFWTWLRSVLLDEAPWSYTGPLYIHWGVVLGTFVAWQQRIRWRRAASSDRASTNESSSAVARNAEKKQ